ncbi:glycosyltransferase family 2 protein [Anaerolineales bacterium HSG25]|nr:glycosyltransferase family 2 protein [Anaerolineales bacterium HSG25]
MPLRASIIIVSYNSRGDLAYCLPALLADSRPDYEIIVVDNNSQDDTVAFVQTYFPTVKLVLNAQNNGFGGGCNLGAKEASGQFLAFLNPDTLIEKDWLAPPVAHHAPSLFKKQGLRYHGHGSDS